MVKNLVIVESPTKAKILKKFLGKEYTVESSRGHIRDLPQKKSDLSESQKKLPYASLAINVEKDFEPLYVITPAKKKVVSKLKSMVGAQTKIWIATDEDREGEAIGWHLLETILKKNASNQVYRIVFHEITKKAILDSLKTPRDLNNDLVEAQQARRILDRLVGYTLSPLLWKKIRFGLSAGRVQSVAVRLIVERERVIQAFIPEESWSITAFLSKDGIDFEAKFTAFQGKKVKLTTEKEAKAILSSVEKNELVAAKIEEKEVKRNPSPPFTTSTLQQEASRKLGFSVKKTMQIAQQLYEGIDLGKEATGLITYMRTDSVNLSSTAIDQAEKVITKMYGQEFAESRRFKTKAKGAQEAHEAIRPTDLSRIPESIDSFLDSDQSRLYKLIWERAIASQMAAAKLKRISVDFLVNDHTFRATGQTIVFPGFMRAYVEGSDDPNAVLDSKEKILPVIKKEEVFPPKKYEKSQHFTKPPARYTEASLVKKMEEEGIGRPSTYAPTISTVITRGYVIKEGSQLSPTDTAYVVSDMLVAHFSNIVDLKFTAKMEDELDSIAEGTVKRVPFLNDFYFPFRDLVDTKDKELKKQTVLEEKTDEICEKCGASMQVKLSRFGKFLSCSKYPDCDFSKPIGEEGEALEKLQEEYKDEACDACKKPMMVKKGRFGEFLACTGYPECKNTKPIIKSTGVKCPVCHGQDLVERRSKKGKIFWSCLGYPECTFALWDQPVEQCAACKTGAMVKKGKSKIVCQQCGEEKKVE